MAECAADIAGVDTLQDARQLPIGERDVVVELRQISTTDLTIPLGEFGSVCESRRRCGATCPRRRGIVRARPINHQEAEVGQRITKGADLPIQHSDHCSRPIDHAVVEPVIAVDDGRSALLGDVFQKSIVNVVDDSQVSGLLTVPLLVPPVQLPRDVVLVLAQCAQSAGVQIHVVDGRHRIDDGFAGACPARLVEDRQRRSVVADDVTIDKAHHVKRCVVHRQVVAESERRCDGNGGPLQAGNDPVLTTHIVSAREQLTERRPPKNEATSVGTGDRERQVRVPASDQIELKRRNCTGDIGFQPCRNGRNMDTGDAGRTGDLSHCKHTVSADAAVSFTARMRIERDLSRLNDPYDLIVIGGGITGVCVAREAAGRGLRTMLIEKGDFGGGTSSATTKYLHGGIRYLETYEFRVVRESLRERRVLALAAPHLVEQKRFLMPAWKWSEPSTPLIGAGVALYSVLGFDANKNAPDSLRIPRPRWLNRKNLLDAVPWLDPEELQGAFAYHDTLNLHPERLLLAFLKSAVTSGATALNHVEATGFVTSPGRGTASSESKGGSDLTVEGVQMRDTLTGDRFEVRARAVVNAGGPWMDLVLATLGKPLGVKVNRSKGVHLLTKPIGGPGVVTDTVFARARSGKHVIVSPWMGRSFIGPTDTPESAAPDDTRVDHTDVELIMETVNSTLADGVPRLTEGDIEATTVGIRPLVVDEGKDSYHTSRRHELYDHGPSGVHHLWSIGGGKWTTGRALGEEAVETMLDSDALQGCSPRRFDSSRVAAGGAFAWAEDAEPYLREAARSRPNLGLPADVRLHLARLYGTEHDRLLDLIDHDPVLARRVSERDGMLDIAAQVVFAVTDEGARTLSDIIDRRLVLGTLGRVTDTEIRLVASVAGPVLGWSSETCATAVTDESKRRGAIEALWRSPATA